MSTLIAGVQALGGAHSVIVYATGAVIGNVLAPDKSLATLPTSIFVVGMALATLPAGAIAHRHGRRAAFLVGGLRSMKIGTRIGAAARKRQCDNPQCARTGFAEGDADRASE